MVGDKISELLTLKQTAELLKVDPTTLRRWDNEGQLKAVRVGTRKGVGDRRYKVEDVENYIKQKKIKK